MTVLLTDIFPSASGPQGPQGSSVYLTWVEISTTTNAVVNYGYLVDSRTGGVTVVLPANPVEGNTIGVCDIYNMSTTNPIVIDRNGENIESIDEDLTIDIDGAGFNLTYSDSTRGWEVVNIVNVRGSRGYQGYQGTQGNQGYQGVSGTTPSSILKSGDYTILDDDGYTTIFISGNTIITLPDANTKRRLYFAKTDTGTTATILRAGSDTIEGNTSVTLNSKYDTLVLESDGDAIWYIF